MSGPDQQGALDEGRRRPMRPRLLKTAAILAAVVVLAALLLAYQASQARAALLRAEGQAQDLKEQISDGDVKAAKATLGELQNSTADARTNTDGLLWDVAGNAPFLGQNLEAVQTVSRVLNAISTDGLTPLVDIADQVNAQTFSPKDGRLDIDAIRRIAPVMASADAALSSGKQELEGIEVDSLAGQLQGPVEKLKTKIDDAQSAASAGAKASQLLPDMLGGSGQRAYIFVIQNNAEIRSTGGLPGAFAILEAKDGKIAMGTQGSGVNFPYNEKPVVKVSRDETRLYSGLLAGYWGDTNFTPDFPRTAEIMRAMAAKELGQKADGVISVDPIALSYILDGTGPVKLADGKSITSDNAVKLLLNDVYFDHPTDNVARDIYFADAAMRVFDAVVSGRGDSQDLLKGLAKAADENRILISSARKDEQSVIGTTRIAGALPRDDGSTPHVGVYFNDATETKLEYYLHRESTVRATKCTRDGVQTLNTTTVLKSTAPKNAGSLPGSILGPGTGEKPGSFRMVMAFYAPYGGLLTELKVNGKEQPINRAEHYGLNVVTIPVLLAPGEKLTVAASMFTGKDQRNDAVFATTPGINATPNNVKVLSACG